VAEIWKYNHFQDGGRSPSWICIDVILLHPGTVFYVPVIMINFQMDWFLIYMHFHLSAFWLEIAHFGPNLDIFER